jgi:hypothetical protein
MTGKNTPSFANEDIRGFCPITLKLQQFIAILLKRNYSNYTGDLVILPLNVFTAYSPELGTRMLTNPL